MPGLDVLLRDLADPRAYPEAAWGGIPAAARRVEVIQTHISAVFLTTARAYKVKKPVRLWGLVDYGTPEARRHWCEEEVRLNRRLAPDVYLGVVPVVERAGRLHVGEPGGAGGAVEHAVAMRRFRAQDTLEARVLAGAAGADDLAALGRLLARFHAAHPLAPAEARAVRAATFAGVLAANVRATRAFVPGLFPERVHAGLEVALARRLRRSRASLRGRLARGVAVDGHGDVRLEHVLVEGPRTSVIDCVEFTRVWRHLDPVADAAFLGMDLLSRGRLDLARAFVRAYVEAADDPGGGLWELFLAYRAHVRAKVDATTSAEAEVPAEQRAEKAASARRHLALAWALARWGGDRPPLVVLRGPSGSGKSVLAAALAPWLLGEVLRSDVVRKEHFGLAPQDRPGAARRAEVYGASASEAVYAALLERGLGLVARGVTAFLDATYLRAPARTAVLRAAADAGVPCVVLDLECPAAVVRERLERRAAEGRDPSDADLAVYEQQVRTAEPLSPAEAPHVVTHAAGTDPSITLMALLDRVAALGGAGPAARRPPGDGAPSLLL